MMPAVRVGVCADFREEDWPSMDRVADALLDHLSRDHARTLAADRICPPFKARASRVSSGPAAMNLDRGCNRLWDYPRHVRRLAADYDVFHVVDHSYSQLVHSLPASRTVVTCHDLDTFRSILQPENDPRSALFRAMTRHILAGLRRAACVTCDTAAVRDELLACGLVPADRIVVAPIGVDPVFSADADPEADREAGRLIAAPPGAVEVLHVGSTVTRKRIDTVLRSIADVRREMPCVRLVRVGGPFTAEQERLLRDLDLPRHVSVLPPLDDRLLAAVYRRAAVVVLPSEREGFGLPIIEAMACGTAVVASDLPVLREVGGGVALHCGPGDSGAWARAVIALVRERFEAPDLWAARRDRSTAWASRFTWAQFANRMADIYSNLAGAAGAVPARERATCLA
jgi:glycosyltransferase involved in cell wall biosynthesis